MSPLKVWSTLLVIAVSGEARAASMRMFSYDPADSETRSAAGPMTFAFRQGLLKTTVLNARSTEAEATIDLAPVGDSALGGERLTALVGSRGADRDLYEIRPDKEGAAMVQALCPGSSKGWLAIGRPRYGQDLGVSVIGDGQAGPRLCKTLAFTFHGEWRLPSQGRYDPRLSSRTRGPSGSTP